MTPSPVAERIRQLPAGEVSIVIPGVDVELWPYQRQDIAWMLAQRNGIIGSEVGTGKTALAIGAAQYLKKRADYWGGMVVLMPKMAGVLPKQWREEIRKFAPGLVVDQAMGGKTARYAAYNAAWDVLLVNYEAARNDTEAMARIFERNRPSILFCDEASAFRNGSSKTARLIRGIQPFFDYRFAATGTPIQTNVEDLHGICSSMGWTDLVGTAAWFRRQYLIQQKVEFWAGGMKRRKWVTIGYKNLDDLRSRLAPWHIRRTLTEPDVAKHIPDVVPFVFRLEMKPAQQRLYRLTQDGVVAKIRDGELQFSYTEAMAKYAHLAAIADGTKTFDSQAADHSIKSDWLLSQLQGSLAGEKVLVFSRFVRSVWPLVERLKSAGIDHGLFLGSSHQSQGQRMRDVDRFKNDPDCRVLLATQAVEMGLNLQVARVLVFYSMLPNPKRLEQILGRIRRAGSPFGSVAAITLLSEGTVEEGIYDTVIERNAVSDAFWEEESVLFEKLGTDRLIQLIRGYRP